MPALFELPPALEARQPPEARGLARDGVRLMVARRRDGRIEHHRFSDLPDLLDPGDLLIVNTSATLPAAVPARRSDGQEVVLHLSTRAPELPDRWWVVELRTLGGASQVSGVVGEHLELAGGADVELVAAYAGGTRLWLARFEIDEPLPAYLARHGHPIRYGHVGDDWPLEAYQTVFATHPGSAEMPSAGRPFTPELVTRLVSAGVLLAPVTLHCAVSSPERHEPPQPEHYAVPEATAALANAVRGRGGLVIAIGTTVVRALETVIAADGRVHAGSDFTNLLVPREPGVRAVDGLVTGWHEPNASHLVLLEAMAGAQLLERSYEAALEEGYLWHEFGDSQLVLP